MLHFIGTKRFSMPKRKKVVSGDVRRSSTASFKMKKPAGYSFDDCVDPRKSKSKNVRY